MGYGNDAVHASGLTDDVLSALTMKKFLCLRLYNVIGYIIPWVYIMRVNAVGTQKKKCKQETLERQP
jgi:hypothetical protein